MAKLALVYPSQPSDAYRRHQTRHVRSPLADWRGRNFSDEVRRNVPVGK
jgi:hypothetical protein